MKINTVVKSVFFSLVFNSVSTIYVSNAEATEPNTSHVEREIRILTQELHQQQEQLNALRSKSDILTQHLRELQTSQDQEIKRLNAQKQEYLRLKQENETLKQRIQNYESQLYRLSQVKK
jgi:uncharacterized protein (DUF3084 family)